jgi:cytoskeleton protein RodZ
VSEAHFPENEADASVLEETTCLPGRVLRAAREAKGLTPDAVAQITRFSVRQIEALERDDYASLPGITAVRGFVRSYAKFLKMDPAPLLAALEPAAPMVVADIRLPGYVGNVEQPTFLRRITSKRMTIALVACLLLLAALWYIIRPGSESIHGFLQMPLATLGVAVAPPAAPETLPVTVPPSAAFSPEASVAPANSTEAAAGSAVGLVIAPTAPVAAAAPPQDLRLEFTDLSWIEIRDATQQVVFSGEYPAGTHQRVAGKSPFQLWIGKASGVQVFFGERSVDLQPYTRADVARLTVE